MVGWVMQGAKSQGKRRTKWKEQGEGGNYKAMKRKYKKLCGEKKRREGERWEREIEGVKTERQVWKVVGRERKRKKRVKQRIEMKE